MKKIEVFVNDGYEEYVLGKLRELEMKKNLVRGIFITKVEEVK